MHEEQGTRLRRRFAGRARSRRLGAPTAVPRARTKRCQAEKARRARSTACKTKPAARGGNEPRGATGLGSNESEKNSMHIDGCPILGVLDPLPHRRSPVLSDSMRSNLTHRFPSDVEPSFFIASKFEVSGSRRPQAGASPLDGRVRPHSSYSSLVAEMTCA